MLPVLKHVSKKLKGSVETRTRGIALIRTKIRIERGNMVVESIQLCECICELPFRNIYIRVVHFANTVSFKHTI